MWSQTRLLVRAYIINNFSGRIKRHVAGERVIAEIHTHIHFLRLIRAVFLTSPRANLQVYTIITHFSCVFCLGGRGGSSQKRAHVEFIRQLNPPSNIERSGLGVVTIRIGISACTRPCKYFRLRRTRGSISRRRRSHYAMTRTVHRGMMIY